LDEKAVADALRSGKIAGAALDVVSTEPITGDNPLLSAPNCIITPHISWAAKECRQRIIDITVGNIRGFMEENPNNVVNP
jgi:glycerate dehydrogenase